MVFHLSKKEIFSPDPTVKDFLIVREKTKTNNDNALQIRNSSAELTIRNFRIVQNTRILKLYAGMYFYGIGSVVRKSLIPASVNKRLGCWGRVCSVIRKFR